MRYITEEYLTEFLIESMKKQENYDLIRSCIVKQEVDGFSIKPNPNGLRVEPKGVHPMKRLKNVLPTWMIRKAKQDGVTGFSIDCVEAIHDNYIEDYVYGYINTERCRRKTTLKFAVHGTDLDDIHIIVIQSSPAQLAPLRDDEIVPLSSFLQDEDSYLWEYSLGMNITELKDKLCENKQVLNDIAQEIIDNILSKIDDPVVKRDNNQDQAYIDCDHLTEEQWFACEFLKSLLKDVDFDFEPY